MRSLFVLLLGLASVLAARPITPEDYFRFEFVGAPALSPDGTQVVFPVTKVSQPLNRRITTLWLVPTAGSAAPRLLSSEAVSSSSPQWSPDGKTIAFLSARGEGARSQIYLLALDGGEPRRLTSLPNGVASFVWSPQGDRFALLSRTGPTDLAKPVSDVRHYTTILYKFNDSGWYDDKRSHIFIADAATGAARQLTFGQDTEDADPQWSPDGQTIAFSSDRTGKLYERSRDSDVWTIPAAGGPLTKISDHTEADSSPRYSPDGKTIAFLGAVKPRQHPKIYLAPATGGKPSVLAVDAMDLIPTNLQFAGPDALLFEAGTRGANHLFRVDLRTRTLKPLVTGERAVRSATLRGDRLVYLANDFRSLDDLYLARRDGSTERRLTTHNAALWKELSFAAIERLAYKSTDGQPIEGFLVKPVGFTEGRKYPLLLNIHGGPASMYGVDWYHEFQVYAGQGYGVFFVNPRGSTGYGEEFARAIKNNWGKMDYVDVMSGLDEALRRHSWIDETRLGVTGGSYGGYLTNWIVSHSNRFQAAVTLRSVSNFISDEGTRDGAFGHDEDFKGNLFDEFDQYWEASPLKYAKNVKTPTLVMHSDNDLRVPLEQGEQWYRALKHYGVTTELVVFPRENHNLTRTGEPKHLVESLNWQLYWFAKYVQKQPLATAPNAQWIELFNGKNLDGWVAKVAKHEVGDNYADTFRVKDGVIQVSYDKYTEFGARFAHLFYKQPFSHFRLALEYRLTGEQMKGGPSYARLNSGVMFHSQAPETILKDQDWPISVEAQFLSNDGDLKRTTMNVCTPGTEIFMKGAMVKAHCTNSTSAIFRGDGWVKVEVEVLGAGRVRHFVNGELVLEYEKPQIGGGVANGYNPAIKVDGQLLREGYIGLQAESHPVEFRNIRLMPLPANGL